MGEAATPGRVKGCGQSPRLKPYRVWVASEKGAACSVTGTTVGTEGSGVEDAEVSGWVRKGVRRGVRY